MAFINIMILSHVVTDVYIYIYLHVIYLLDTKHILHYVQDKIKV